MAVIWTKQFYRTRDLAIRKAWEEEVISCAETLCKWIRDDRWPPPKKDDYRKMNAPRK
jgi:hypothetical protein